MEDTQKEERILSYIAMIYDHQKKLEEKIDCVLHAVCQSNDDKTREAITEYLGSEYRGTQSR